MSNFLFFDTETTGLPKDWKAPMNKLDNWPRVIQLAAQMYSLEGELIESFETLIKPDGWFIPNEKFWIENGFNQDKSEKNGVPIVEALKKFIDLHNQSVGLVAHNMSYDYNVLGSEMIRCDIKCNKKLQKYCTKEIGTNFCQLPGPYGWKWPKLEELYYELFGKQFDGAHQAISDVKATSECFFELKKRGVFKIK